MRRTFDVLLLPAEPPRRVTLFAIRAVDAVTLSTVSQGLKVVAEGLKGKPIVNASGLFVWLDEDLGRLKKVTIDPGTLPYEGVERERTQLQLPPLPTPLTTIELPPRLDYPFSAGITGLRGRFIEEHVLPPESRVPVRNAEVRLRWLDGDGLTWHDAPTVSHTNSDGDFVSIMRLAPTEVPQLDGNGAVTVRLRARRDAGNERTSTNFTLLEGRVADPSNVNDRTFAWDELLP